MEKRFDSIISDIFRRAKDVCFDLEEAIQGLKSLLKFDSKYFRCQEDQLSKFCISFINCLRFVLVSNEHHTPYSINFVGQFLFGLENESELLVQNEILSFLIRNNKANSKLVRCHIYEIMEKFLHVTRTNSTSSRQLDERLFVHLQHCIVEGMRDRDLNAQLAAIRAAYSLQVPHDRHCVIVNAYLSLLEHDSITAVRLLVLDLIVINNATLEFFHSKLLFDSDVDVRNRLVSILIKKVPNEFFSSAFRRNLIECVLFRNENQELAEALLFKWLDLSSKCKNPILRFISSLEVGKEWFHDFDSKQVSYNHSKLLHVMELVYTMVLSESNDLNSLISALEQVTVAKLLSDLDAAFYYRSLAMFVCKLKFDDLFDKRTPARILKCILEARDQQVQIAPLILYNLVESLFCLSESMCHDASLLFKLIESIDIERGVDFLFDCLLSKYEPRMQIVFFWTYYAQNANKTASLKKLLTLFASILANLSDTDFERVDEWIGDEDADFFDTGEVGEERNVMHYLLENLLLKNVPNLDPDIRALVARGLGLISLMNLNVWLVNVFIKMVINDYPQVVIEAQKALFNIVLFYSHRINTSDPKMIELWSNLLETLENQFDCLEENIFYVTCEGFCKLLVNECRLESKEKVITRLLIAYMSTEDETYTKKKLLSCLNSFFHVFKSINTAAQTQLMRSFLPTMKFLMSKRTSLAVLKRLAKFFNYLANDTNNMRQLLIAQVLNEILAHFGDFYRVQKMIDILLEFRIHQSDIDRHSMSSLVKIYSLFNLIIAKFKEEKWRLAKEDELKEVMNEVKKLIVANEGSKEALKRVNQNSIVCDKDSKISRRC